ncbi:MAG: hypothetical protein UW73_C0039G0009 [Microgenomates group bacterium GW2011_GWB1_44_8]|nr:MAG: hypothetical protein UW73_C0039G0009 [Microgenomates group bacterium GW2011_GWB1_44_8]
MLNQLNSFIINERFRFQTEDDNKFAITFSEMSLYLQYLYIILDEYSKYSDEFVKNTKELQGTLRDGANAVTPEQNELFTRSREIMTSLRRTLSLMLRQKASRLPASYWKTLKA